jgi:quinohemoprotein ethanol dehydrogenase
MSFNPQTGLVYIPAQNVPMNLTAQKNWTHNASIPGNPMSGLGWNLGYDVNVTPPTDTAQSRL